MNEEDNEEEDNEDESKFEDMFDGVNNQKVLDRKTQKKYVYHNKKTHKSRVVKHPSIVNNNKLKKMKEKSIPAPIRLSQINSVKSVFKINSDFKSFDMYSLWKRGPFQILGNLSWDNLRPTMLETLKELSFVELPNGKVENFIEEFREMDFCELCHLLRQYFPDPTRQPVLLDNIFELIISIFEADSLYGSIIDSLKKIYADMLLPIVQLLLMKQNIHPNIYVFSLQRNLGSKRIFYNKDMDLNSFHIFNNFQNQPSFVLVVPLSESISIFHSDEISKSLLLLMKGDFQFEDMSESFGILEKYMFNFMVPVIINQASLIHWYNEGSRDALMLMVPIDVYYAADMITTFTSRNNCSGPLSILYVNELDEQYVVNMLNDILKYIKEKVADVVNAKDKKYISQLIQNFDSSLERKSEVNINDVVNITDSATDKATVDKMLRGQLKLRKKYGRQRNS